MKKYLALILAIVMIVAVFSQTAMAVTYAPAYWVNWPTQSTSSYNTMCTKAIQRYCNLSINAGLMFHGVYGANEYDKVKVLQNKLGAVVTGTVNSSTWNKMFQAMTLYTTNTAGNVYRTPKYKSNGTVEVSPYNSFLFDTTNIKWMLNTYTGTSTTTAYWDYIKY